MAAFTGEDLLAERKRRKLSRRELSELVGLSQGVIKNLEDGRDIKPHEEAALRNFMGGGDGEAEPTPPTSESEGDPPSLPFDVPPLFLIDPEDDDDTELVTVINEPHEFVPHLVQPEPEPTPDITFADDVVPLSPPAVPVVVGRLISNSELQTFKRCRRKWWLGWYRHLRMKMDRPAGARAIGTWVHLALAQYYVPDGTTRTDPREALERVLLEVNTVVTQYAGELVRASDDGGFSAEAIVQDFKKDADMARAMVEGYVQWLEDTGADSGLTVMSSEQMIAAPFDKVTHNEDVYVVGKLDVRARRNIDGARMFLDHKTVASIDRAQKMLHMNEQMLHYKLLEQLQPESAIEGELTGGALYNMLRKVKRTGNAKPPFFQRVEVQHNNHEVEAYVMHLTSTANDMLQAERSLREGMPSQYIAPPSPRDDCTWSCDFYHVCPLFDDGSRAEDMVANYYVETEHLDYYGDSLAEMGIGSSSSE